MVPEVSSGPEGIYTVTKYNSEEKVAEVTIQGDVKKISGNVNASLVTLIKNDVKSYLSDFVNRYVSAGQLIQVHEASSAVYSYLAYQKVHL